MATSKPDGKDGAYRTLTGCSVLVAEDEYLIARDITSALQAHGAQVLGPCPELSSAMEMLDTLNTIDGAVIDLNLRGVRAFALAAELQRRGIGFVIATGYDPVVLPDELAHAPRCTKPIDYDALVTLLHQQIGICH